MNQCNMGDILMVLFQQCFNLVAIDMFTPVYIAIDVGYAVTVTYLLHPFAVGAVADDKHRFVMRDNRTQTGFNRTGAG